MERVALYTYHYDPLDRLTGTKSARQSDSLRFYCQNRITTEIQGTAHHSIMQQGNQILAQLTHEPHQQKATLCVTDSQRSILHTLDTQEQHATAYTAYGHHPTQSGFKCLSGYNGERADAVTGHYLLGNGYRVFNPVLMRFNSPDSLSPFDQGGINTYAYCLNNPINQIDPSGHITFKQAGKLIISLLHRNNISSPRKRIESPDPNAVGGVKWKETSFRFLPNGDTEFREVVGNLSEYTIKKNGLRAHTPHRLTNPSLLELAYTAAYPKQLDSFYKNHAAIPVRQEIDQINFVNEFHNLSTAWHAQGMPRHEAIVEMAIKVRNGEVRGMREEVIPVMLQRRLARNQNSIYTVHPIPNPVFHL